MQFKSLCSEAYFEIDSHMKRRGIGYDRCIELSHMININYLTKENAIQVGQCMSKLGYKRIKEISLLLGNISDNTLKDNIKLWSLCKCLSKI